MKKEILELAAATMKVTIEEAQLHFKPVPEINGYYFWNPVRGGIAVMIDEKCERLGAGSAVSYEKHLAAFLDGKRN